MGGVERKNDGPENPMGLRRARKDAEGALESRRSQSTGAREVSLALPCGAGEQEGEPRDATDPGEPMAAHPRMMSRPRQDSRGQDESERHDERQVDEVGEVQHRCRHQHGQQHQDRTAILCRAPAPPRLPHQPEPLDQGRRRDQRGESGKHRPLARTSQRTRPTQDTVPTW